MFVRCARVTSCDVTRTLVCKSGGPPTTNTSSGSSISRLASCVCDRIVLSRLAACAASPPSDLLSLGFIASYLVQYPVALYSSLPRASASSIVLRGVSKALYQTTEIYTLHLEK